jgi:tetratricopeptide (TPR) repeat protein
MPLVPPRTSLRTAASLPSPLTPVKFRLPENLKWPAIFFIAAMALLIFGSQIHPLGDPDVYLHMRDGRYWMENGFKLEHDPFTYAAPDEPMEAIEVLFCTGLYAAWKLGGFDLLILLKAAVMTAVFLILGLLIYRRWPTLPAAGAILTLGLATPTMINFFRERPYLFTYLFLVIALLLLDDWRRADAASEPVAARRLWWLPALTIVWVNLHPGFLVIFGFLGAQLVEDGLSAWFKADARALRRCLWLGWVSAAILAAGALNPMGFAIYPYAVSQVSAKIFMKYILEWKPVLFAAHPDFFVLLGFAWLLQLLTLRSARIYDLLTLLIFSYLAVSSNRNIPLFLLAALPPLAGNLRQLLTRWFPHRGLAQRWHRLLLVSGGAAALALLLTLSATANVMHLGRLKNYFAEDALAWLQNQPIQGRVIMPLFWADYFTWETKGRVKVFLDGRLQRYSEKMFMDYLIMTSGDVPQLLPVLDHYQIEILVVEYDKPLGYYMRLDESGQWALVYFDDLGYIFARRSEANRAWIDAHEYHRLAAWKPDLLAFDTTDLPGSLAEAHRAAAASPHSFFPHFLAGQILMGLHEQVQAIAEFQQVLTLDPKQYTARFNLGLLLSQQGDWPAAKRQLDRALAEAPAGPVRDEMLRQVANLPAGQ